VVCANNQRLTQQSSVNIPVNTELEVLLPYRDALKSSDTSGIVRTKLPDGPNPFSSLRFANEPLIPAKPGQFSSVIPNDPRQPFLNSSRTIRPNQIQSFNNNPTERTQESDETPGTEVDNALRLAAGIGQQSASFVGQAEPNSGLSPDNFSAPFASGNRPFHERHLDSARLSGDASQGYYIPFQMGNLNRLSVQSVGPFGAGQDLPNRTSHDHHVFGSLGDQNGEISKAPILSTLQHHVLSTITY
jgi:hypothetical protein